MSNQTIDIDPEQNVTHDGYQLIPNGRFCSDNQSEVPRGDRVVRHMNNVRLWTEFNKKLPHFEGFYEGKSESFLLQSIFLQVNHIAKEIGVDHDDIPIGVFCSTKEDLAKLDELLARIDYRLKAQERQGSMMPTFCGCIIL